MRIASRYARRLHVSTMSSCLSTAAPSFHADSLNSSRRRRDDVLPYEILSAIFSYISHSHILHLRHLLFVCRSWSHVISQEAGLWSSIRINRELHQYFDECKGFNKAQAANFVSLCISRSRSHPLSIIMDLTSFGTWSGMVRESVKIDMFPLFGILIGPLGQHALRWHSLEWHALIHMSEIISILPPRLPQRKYLRLYWFEWDQQNKFIFPPSPNLEVVELHEHREYERQLFGECHSHTVKELLVESEWVWHVEDLLYFASFKSILRLTLSSSLEGAQLLMKDPEKIHLPQLKALRLKGCVHLDLVGLLGAPSLNKVEFDHNESITSIASHLVSTNIETIAALIPPPSSVSPHMTIAAALIDLVTSLHGLRILWIKKWIYDLLTADDCPLDTSGILGHAIRLIIED